MQFDQNGIHDVPAGKIAAVVTYLEMRQRPPQRSRSARAELALRHVSRPEPDWYRDLYRRIGADWLWFSRLQMPDDELRAILRDPAVEIYALTRDGADKGLLELDRRRSPDIELAFFGVSPDLIGTGAGRWLIDQAIDRAFAHEPERFWVHTCTLDHANALAFYQRAGFRPYKRAVEIADDPRLDGVLARDAAAHVPVID